MTRSVWKGPFVDVTLLKKAKSVSDSGKKEVIKPGLEGQLYCHSLLV